MKQSFLRFCFGLATVLCANYQLKAQTVTFPRNDIADERLNLYAFTNATIVADPQTVIEGGTLLVKGAYIQALGKDIKIPAGAVVIDCKGKRIYPSLVEIDSDYGMPEIKRERSQGFFGGTMESQKKGSYAWNAAIQPENEAEKLFVIQAPKAEELRKLGFGAVVAHPHDGIVRGTSALVALTDDREQNALLKGNVSAHYSFNKGSSTQSYPNSMMGAVALLRQTLYDAQWYKKAQNKTEYNISLDRLSQNLGLPQIFETEDRFGILRADKVGDELGIQYIIRGGGDEYQRLDEIKATNASLIVGLNFPQAFDVEDPIDAQAVSLAEMKHWELAPTNLATLQKAGINFVISSSQNKNKADFWTNLRKAIEYGLPETEALKALTTTPASLLKIDGLVGSLKTGMVANFLITSDNLFNKDNQIMENWVKGKRYILSDMSQTDMRGKYNLVLTSFAEPKPVMQLNITGKATAPDYQLVINDTLKVTPKVSRYNNFLTIQYSTKQSKGDIRLSGYYDNKNIRGDGELPDGKPVKFIATFTSAVDNPVVKTDTTKRIETLGDVLYPFVGFGAKTKPKAETILVKNATVWTNEKEGVVAGIDVLIKDSKIAQVGKNLIAPQSSRVIDGTGKHLTNGIFDEHSHIALFAINEGGQTVTAEVREEDVVNPDDINIYRQLAGGVTSSQLLHGSANSIGGQSALIKLKWGESVEGLKIKGADGYIKFALGENVTRKNSQTSVRAGGGEGSSVRYPMSRTGVEQVMMDAFTRAKEYDAAWKKYNALPDKEKATAVAPRRDIELDALAEIINKKRFITCHSYVQSEIQMLMRVAEKFNFNINTFTHILEGYKLADLMAKHGSGGSTFSDWWAYKVEVKDAIPHNPALMAKAGVVVSINSDDAEMARRLNQEAAKSIQVANLSEEDAWKMVTLNPAKLMHLDHRMGSIKAGKDADLVLWSTNPLSIYARPHYTMIDGTVYFSLEDDQQKQAYVEKERARLIQKMLTAKSGGAAVTKPSFKKMRMFHCEDEGDINMEEEH